jgi:hypothetical protein
MASSAMKRTYMLGVWLAILIALSQAQSNTSSTPTASEEMQEQLDQLQEGVNASWLILTGALVFMMQAGFAVLGTFLFYCLF